MEYPKIETLYERDNSFKVKVGEFKNRTYSMLKTWHWTEKVDGTNIRCTWNPITGTVTFGGRTDSAQIHADLVGWLMEHVTAEKLAPMFPNKTIIYGEGFGAGIQKGGGDYSPVKKLIIFDVLVDDKWWLNYEGVVDVASKLGLEVVPSFGEMSLEEATERVRTGIKSRCSINPNKQAEGLVGRPLETLFDKKGHRLITKLKTKDF